MRKGGLRIAGGGLRESGHSTPITDLAMAAARNEARPARGRTDGGAIGNPQSGVRTDQAAGLRALFARPTVRVLPILVSSARSERRDASLAQLAQAFARLGERTLVIDAARVHVAAAYGLRARYDLAHALGGACAAEEALLDAGPNLMVLPAARAFDAASQERRLLDHLVTGAAAVRGEQDLVVLLAQAQHAGALSLREWLAPVEANPESVSAVLADIGRVDAVTDIAVFRLLFLGMSEVDAATLAQRMGQSAARRIFAELGFGGATRGAGDFARVVRTALTWDLPQVVLPDLETLS
jgi:hypothetical protein